MKLPKAMLDVMESFEKLPGIGPKTAQRLAFYLLHVPQGELDKFSDAMQRLKKGTLLCSNCYTIAESDPCTICIDERRDKTIVCVVEQPYDILALEKTHKYLGIYHVLHGKIDPLNNIGPDEIYISQLIAKVERESNVLREVILATNPTMEGEATAMYVAKQIKKINQNLHITRIGRGLPMGADLEYADDITLLRAMEGRQDFSG